MRTCFFLCAGSVLPIVTSRVQMQRRGSCLVPQQQDGALTQEEAAEAMTIVGASIVCLI